MQCEHEACGCEAPEGERWCSERCREAGKSGSPDDDLCRCAHPECEQEAG